MTTTDSWHTGTSDWDEGESEWASPSRDERLDSPIESDRYAEFEDSTMGEIIRHRQERGQDFQAIITSMGGERGLGKTTLAVQLARAADLNGWSIEKAFMSVHRYMNHYINHTIPGDCLVQDETEIAADGRRWMSGGNVKFSQVIQACRFKEVSSIYTLPTRSNLDSRIFGLCTFWILVTGRGEARVFWITENNFTGDIGTYPVPNGNGAQEKIYWDPLDHDEEYQELSDMKDEFMTRFINGEMLDDEEGDPGLTEKELKKHEAGIRDEMVRGLHEHTDWPQTKIADFVDKSLDHNSCSQGLVSRIVNPSGV